MPAAASFHVLQDVEKLAARKGVVLQSIKEVLQVSCFAASACADEHGYFGKAMLAQS